MPGNRRQMVAACMVVAGIRLNLCPLTRWVDAAPFRITRANIIVHAGGPKCLKMSHQSIVGLRPLVAVTPLVCSVFASAFSKMLGEEVRGIGGIRSYLANFTPFSPPVLLVVRSSAIVPRFHVLLDNCIKRIVVFTKLGAVNDAVHAAENKPESRSNRVDQRAFGHQSDL